MEQPECERDENMDQRRVVAGELPGLQSLLQSLQGRKTGDIMERVSLVHGLVPYGWPRVADQPDPVYQPECGAASGDEKPVAASWALPDAVLLGTLPHGRWYFPGFQDRNNIQFKLAISEL